MYTIKIATNAALNVSEVTLKSAPQRLLQFLGAVSDRDLRITLGTVGFSELRVRDGYELIEELKIVDAVPAEADPVPDAIAYCETWQGTDLVRARAMLQLSHPEQADFLFGDLEPGKGAAAVVNASLFLQRRQQMEKGTDRKDTHKADIDALHVIEETGFTKAIVKKLQDMVDIAQSAASSEGDKGAAEQLAARLDVLRKMHAFVTAWGDMARTVVTRRDQLIRLGIAKRRQSKGKAVIAPPVPVVAPPAITPAVPTTPATPVVTPPVVIPPVAVTPALPATPVAITPPAIPAMPAIPSASSPAPAAANDEGNGPASRAA